MLKFGEEHNVVILYITRWGCFNEPTLLCLIYQICFTFASNQILDKAMKKTINFEFGRTFSCIPKFSLFFNLMKIDRKIIFSDLRQNLEKIMSRQKSST